MAWAKFSKVKEGDKLITDGGFTCMEFNVEKKVWGDKDGRLYIECSDGCHYLDGQVDFHNDHDDLIGLTPIS